MSLRGKMKKLYKLGCILNNRKPGDKHLACGRFEQVEDNLYEWCDVCKYKKE